MRALCPALHCSSARGDRQFFCVMCWRRLPPALREAVALRATAVPGSEYCLAAVRAALDWLDAHPPSPPGGGLG